MGPFIKSEDNTSKMMFRVIIALIPIIIFSFYKNGVLPYLYGTSDLLGMFKPLIIIGVSTIATFLFETIYQVLFCKDKDLKTIIGSSYAYMPGLFLGLIIPINTPISVILVGAFFASIVGKMLFGGFGKNIFNPALIGGLIVTGVYSLVIIENGGYLNTYELDTISGATPLSNASMIADIGTYKQLVEPYGSLWDFFVGTIPGAVGETSALFCLLGFIFLTATKTIKWRIPVCYITTVFFMTLCIGLYNGVGLWYPLFQILSGGLMLGAIFMATDPVTSPTTKSGQVIYGLCLGVLTVVLRYLTPYPEGVLTSILTLNMLVFIIDSLGFKAKFDRKKLVIPMLLIVLMIVSMIFVIGNKKDVVVDNSDPNFEIVSKEEVNGITTYVVTEKGYSSKLKLEIVIKDDEITKIEVLEQNDSFFAKIIDADYTQKLKEEQETIEDCDTVSGATITSKALKKAVINTLSDYRGE